MMKLIKKGGLKMGGKSLKVFVVLVFFFTAIVLGQESQVKEENNEKLKAEILSVFKSKGEEGLRNFVKSKEGEISNKFIVKIADSGIKERNEEWLKVSEIMAEEKKNEKTWAAVLFRISEYFIVISDNGRAADYLDKALPVYIKLNDPVGQGNVYLRKGIIYFLTGDNSRALEMYEKAFPFFENTKDLIGQGNIYWRKGDFYLRIGKNSSALEMYDKALPLFEKAGDPLGQGNIYLGKGIIFSYTGNNSEALMMYKLALSFFEKVGEFLCQGNVYLKMGNIYLGLCENSKAFEMYDKALYFFEKAGNLVGQGNICFRKGHIYLGIGEKSRALEMYEKALLFFEKAGNLIGKANVYQDKGNLYFYTGDNYLSLEMNDRALLFYEKAGSPIGQGNVYLSKGNIYSHTGEIFKAFEMYDKALPFFEKAGEPLGQGNIYFKKGTIYSGITENLKALEMYDKALTFFEKAEDPFGQGAVYLGKGNIYFYNGDNSKALEMYDKSLLFSERAEDPIGQGNVYLDKGAIYLRIGESSKSFEMYDKALSFFEKGGYPNGQGDVYLGKGNIYFYSGENLKSLEMYNTAFPFYKKTGDIESESNALYSKARVLAKLGKKDEALNLFEKSISNLEKIRTQTPSSEMKRTFMEKLYEQYDEAAAFMLENKYYDRAFKYVELMKSRVFLDRLSEGLVSLEKGITPELKQKRDDLVSKLSILTKEMSEAAGKDDEKKLTGLKAQYQKVQNDFEELLVKIRLNNPFYASVQYPEPLSLQDLQENVLKKEDLLLRYFVSRDAVYVFVISKEDFNVIKLGLKADQLQKIVQEYLLSIEEKDSREARKYGIQLYRLLVKPLESTIKDRKEIIVIPDGELAKVPFESLIIDDLVKKNSHYLLEKYRVKYIQSASILAILRKHYQRNSGAGNFIGFGDPVYDTQDLEKEKTATNPSADIQEDVIGDISRSRYRSAGGILTRLKGSGEEVNTISDLFKKQSQKCVVYLRQDANETNAKAQEIKEFDYIHFSCHGILADDFQGLVLSQLPQSAEDGYLTLNEIMNCDYNAKLVVLSACQTGKGKMEKGEGITGLTQAVMYAGTPAVIASLWNVDDISTKELMVGFYKYMLEEGAAKEEALRKTKLGLLKSKKYSSPFFWGAFVMYGE